MLVCLPMIRIGIHSCIDREKNKIHLGFGGIENKPQIYICVSISSYHAFHFEKRPCARFPTQKQINWQFFSISHRSKFVSSRDEKKNVYVLYYSLQWLWIKYLQQKIWYTQCVVTWSNSQFIKSIPRFWIAHAMLVMEKHRETFQEIFASIWWLLKCSNQKKII